MPFGKEFILITLLLALVASPAPTSAAQPAEWRRFADCAAVHYADAQIIDLNRTAPMKAQIMELGRRYGSMATELRHTETGDPKDKAFAYTKSYIMERTRLLALGARPDLQPMLAACPKPPS